MGNECTKQEPQAALQKADVNGKPLTECMIGRDKECDHPQCPVSDEDAKNGIYCTLPLYDWRD